MHGRTLRRLVAFTLWFSQWEFPLVSADGFIAFPPEQFEKAESTVEQPRASGGGGLRGQQNEANGFNLSASGTNKQRTQTTSSNSKKKNEKDSALTSSSSSSSLKRLIDESIPNCGKSHIDVVPVDVTSADKFQWRSANAGYNKPSKVGREMRKIFLYLWGPCEIWIDSQRVFESQDCAKIFPDELGTIKFDYSPCRGECLLTFYWLETGNGNESKPTKHCVPIRNGKHLESDSSSKTDSGSKSTTASGSGSSSSSGSASDSGSGPGSRMDNNSKWLVVLDDLRDLGALSKLYDAVYGSGRRRNAPSRKPLVRHHKMLEPIAPKWCQRPLVAAPEPYFGGYGYSAEYTKSTTQQCKYASNGDFTCSSTERITDSFQLYGGGGGDDDLSDIAYQATADAYS